MINNVLANQSYSHSSDGSMIADITVFGMES